MDVFKLQQGAKGSVFKIIREVYFEMTGRKEPFVKKKSTGIKNESYYAVCPECDNPIQIIGIFKNTIEAGSKPYGRHHKGDIPKLAKYNEEEYYNCIYSNPKYQKASAKRSMNSLIGKQSLLLMKEQFDRVIYILQKDMEMNISTAFARKMLENYIAEEAWLYQKATLNNLPWMLPQATSATPLFGKSVLRGSGLHKAIVNNYPKADFVDVSEKYVKVVGKDNLFINVDFIISAHNRKVVGKHLAETITFWVFYGDPENLQTVYKKQIDIQTDYFLNLINKASNEDKRNLKFLDIAAQLIK